MSNSQTKSPYSAKDEQKLMTELWDPQIALDLEAYVLFSFPWGKANTPLEKLQGPRTWQRDELQKITAHIRENRIREARGLMPLVYKSATVSGRGPGKSALVAWLNLWMMSTNLGASTVVTANTETQLTSKTWPEVGKWHTLAINSHWFEKAAMSLKPAEWFKKSLKDQLKIDTGYYYALAQLWSEDNPDAFAGLHNQYGIAVIYDEASGIPKPIWTVTEGYFTDPVLHRYWFVFSNGRRNTGSFFECFHKNRNFWPNRRQIDSREVEGTDKTVLQQIIEQHGEDSDEARIEVKGQFPRRGTKQFISSEVVAEARARELFVDQHAALIMGVDPARYGDDKTVICFRQGRDARSIPMVELMGADNMRVANLCGELIEKYRPDAVCVDAGNGTGIIDRLREVGHKVHEVWFGGKTTQKKYANHRTEIWGEMREWLIGGCLPNDQDLEDDLIGPEYDFMGSSDLLMLESKDHMKDRGLASPDKGDALACTFHVKVPRRDLATLRKGIRGRVNQVARDVDYDPLGNS